MLLSAAGAKPPTPCYLLSHAIAPIDHAGASTFLGFFNRPCAAPGAGPGLRPAGVKFSNWRTWSFVVVGKDAHGRDIVEISTFYGISASNRCKGRMRPSTAACAGAKVGIGSGASARWVVVPVKGGRVDGAFYLVAAVSVAWMEVAVFVCRGLGIKCLLFFNGAPNRRIINACVPCFPTPPTSTGPP